MVMNTYKEFSQDEDFLSFVEDYKKCDSRRERNVVIIDMAYYFDVYQHFIRMMLVRHGEYIAENKCK